jgi:hypothetical protein
MFYRPDLMIYLWMLPVLGMVVLPALWTMTCMLYQAVERSRLVDVRGFIEVNHQGAGDQAGRERRKSPRVRIEGAKANVAREINCCRISVSNISHHGICFTNIPRKMYLEEDKLKVVFRTREQDYTMFVQPKWMEKEENCAMLGAEIVTIPAGWESFVNGLSRPFVAEAA